MSASRHHGSDNESRSSDKEKSRRSADDSGSVQMRERDSRPLIAGNYKADPPRELEKNYDRGDMRTPTGHSESTSSRRDNPERTEQSSRGKDNRDHDHRDRRDADRAYESGVASERTHSSRDKNRERSRSRDKNRHRDDRHKDDPPSIGGSIPDLNDTRPEHELNSRSKRSEQDPQQDAPRSEAKRSEPQSTPHTQNDKNETGHSSGAIAGGDSVMKGEDDLDQDAEMDYHEARVSNVEMGNPVDQNVDPQTQVPNEQVSRDMALAMQIQEEEEANLESDSESDSGPEIPPKSQESGAKRLWAAVAGSSSSSSSASDPTKYRSKIRELTKQLEQAINGYHHYEQKYRREQQAHQQTWHNLQHLDLQFNSARRHIHHQEEEIRGTKFELQNVKQQLSDAVNLSEVRGKELKGAQVFLTKADTLSTSDVVQKVGTLNEEVFQAAALLGEMLVYEVYGEDVDRDAERKRAIEENHDKAVWMLGEYLFGILAEQSLSSSPQPTNPLLVQIVMQSALAKWCSQVVEKWQPGNTSASELIEGIYDNIRTSEDQAVAGRWRSLTRAHLHYSTSTWTTNILEGILSVINVAGWARPPQSDIEQFEKRLVSIFKAIQDVRKATGEDVTSADLEVTIIEANADFEPAWMEDAYGDDRASKGKKGAPEKVVSTTGLGLRRIVIKRPQKGPITKTAEMLSFPKVVLEKTVKEAMEPPPPSKGKRKKGGDGPAGAGGGIMSFIGIS